MDFTGERYVPGLTGAIRLEHLQRYGLAREIVRDKRVLDIACGQGYGSAILARSARAVVGIDIDIATAREAGRAYRGVPRVSFVAGACEAIPLATASIDVVVSFETIEHLESHTQMIREIRRVLTPDGLLVISSPDQDAYSQTRQDAGANPFHVHELGLAEFDAMLHEHFANVRMWGQRLAIGAFTYELGVPPERAATGMAALTVDGDVVRPGVTGLPAPVYCLATCSDGPLEEVQLDSIAVAAGEDLYAVLVDDLLTLKPQFAAERARLLTLFEQERQASRVRFQELTHSRSWRWTAPLRAIRRQVDAVTHRVALRLERTLRNAYRHVPLRNQGRWKLKSAVFHSIGWLMRGTASYQHWQATQARTLAGAAGVEGGQLAHATA